MDQFSSKNESPFKLPEVNSEPGDAAQDFEAASTNVDEKAMSQAIEKNNLNSSISASAQQPTSTPMIDPLSLPKADPIAQPTQPTKIPVTSALPANDADLIEKAWVTKAKAIVEQTKNDPYEQSNELKKIRNDYLSKRFNANVKLDKE